jgi:signal transduction histidine kinase
MNSRTRLALKYGAILLLILVISVFHFETGTENRYLHEVYQRIYYIPILLAAFWFGPLLGVLSAVFTSLIYVVHIQRDWTHFPHYAFNQYAEIIMYHLVALVTGLLALKGRRRRESLEKTSEELSEAYQKLQSTFDYLKKTDRLAVLGQLSAAIAHEIRNPLGSIKGSVEILETEIGPGNPKHEFVRIIKEEVARLNSLVTDFLRFARPPRPNMERVPIATLIESTLNILQKEAAQSRVRIVRHDGNQLPELNLDSDQIRQVLLNVMLNGIQAMPEGGTLQVSTYRSREGPYVVIDVSDTGPGIEDDKLERIFDPFFTTKPQGTGLGLSISYQLIENHGGRLSAHRNPEKGLTFRLELPLSQSAPVQSRASQVH